MENEVQHKSQRIIQSLWPTIQKCCNDDLIWKLEI